MIDKLYSSSFKMCNMSFKLHNFVTIFLIWVHFYPFYFLFPSEGAYVSNDLGEYTSKDSDDYDKPEFFFGPRGIRRMVIQLLGQLDSIELH